jgi:hypothetical protein
LSEATLQFWTWHDIEADWDYGYVTVSADDGATWQILRGPSTVDTNPHGNSHGWGYTGLSTDGSPLFSIGLEYVDEVASGEIPSGLWQEFESQGITLSARLSLKTQGQSSRWQIKDEDNDKTYILSKEDQTLNIYAGSVWINERIDLSPYAGQQILLRFEYITDDALNLPGWAIDDVSIPELGYLEDFEDGEGGWLGEGFVWTNNGVPQNYLVQLITFGPQTRVQRLPLRDDQSARWHLSLAEADHAVLLVSGVAPVTTEAAGYYYRLERE